MQNNYVNTRNRNGRNSYYKNDIKLIHFILLFWRNLSVLKVNLSKEKEEGDLKSKNKKQFELITLLYNNICVAHMQIQKLSILA